MDRDTTPDFGDGLSPEAIKRQKVALCELIFGRKAAEQLREKLGLPPAPPPAPIVLPNDGGMH